MRAILSIADQCFSVEVEQLLITKEEKRTHEPDYYSSCHDKIEKFDFLTLTGRVTVMEDEGNRAISSGG